MVLRLRFDDYSRATRSRTFPQATAHTATILAALRELLALAAPVVAERGGLTLLGIAVANLTDDRPVQLTLPFDVQGGSALDEALDDVRDRFGGKAVTRTVLLGRDVEPTIPLLRD